MRAVGESQATGALDIAPGGLEFMEAQQRTLLGVEVGSIMIGSKSEDGTEAGTQQVEPSLLGGSPGARGG